MATSPSDNKSSVAARLIDGVALFLILVVIGLRPLVQEVQTTALASFDRAVGAAGGLDPTFSLLMTLMILSAALLVWIGRIVHPRAWRLSGIEWGAAALAAVAMVSCFFASDRRIAINESINWLALPLLAIVAVQLFDRPRAASLAVAVIIASAATFAFQCVRQVRGEFEQTIKSYEERREEIWSAQGVSLDDPQVTLFERRLHGREAFGYGAHSNVAGGYLMGAGFVAAAAAVSRFSGASSIIWIALAALNGLIAAGLFATIRLTGSRGAIAAGVLGMVLIAIGWMFRRSISAHPRRWLMIGWLLAAVVAGGVVTYGAVRGTLPTSSMKFRWGYWRNSMRIVAAHPIVGVGAGNFANHYPSVKPVTDPEEVADPHNFLVSAATQWGIPGGLAMLAMVFGASAALAARRRDESLDERSDRAPPEDPDWLRSAGWIALWTAGLAITIFTIRHVYVGSTDMSDYAYGYEVPRQIWVAAFLLAYVSSATLGITSGGLLTRRGRAIIGIGLLAMLVHACVEMTLFQFGSAVTFFAMVALSGAAPEAPAGSASRRRAIVGTVLSGAAMVAVLALAVVPTVRVMRHLIDARTAVQRSAPPGEVRAAYDAAVTADPLDPNPPAEMASWLVSRAREASAPALAAEAVRYAQVTAARNSASASVWRGLATLQAMVFASTGEFSALQGAVDAARRAVSRYPGSPSAHLMLAELSEQQGRKVDGAARADSLREAADAYQRALELDAQRDSEEIRRFSDAKREAIQARLSSVLGLRRSHDNRDSEASPQRGASQTD